MLVIVEVMVAGHGWWRWCTLPLSMPGDRTWTEWFVRSVNVGLRVPLIGRWQQSPLPTSVGKCPWSGRGRQTWSCWPSQWRSKLQHSVLPHVHLLDTRKKFDVSCFGTNWWCVFWCEFHFLLRSGVIDDACLDFLLRSLFNLIWWTAEW
jgi:hypothetical protein